MLGGRNRWRLILIGFGMSLAVILTLYKFEWTGFGQGDSVSTTINKKDADGNIVETITTTTEPGKTLWDWLSLLGVPLTLAILGYILQQQERSRANNEAKEEILQNYFDRLSTLLVDKNILAIAVKVYPPSEKQGDDQPKRISTPEERELFDEERELFDSAVHVIRARTLSILRRFEGDGERKGSVIRFLIEADVISKAKLSLSKADLRRADLRGAALIRANLSEADLSGANLYEAFLYDANLSEADLSRANLSRAFLYSANLSKATLEGAVLIDIQWDEHTQWPAPTEVAKAKNLPEALKQQLRITDTPTLPAPNP
jgi:hypothetical protein